MGKGKVEKTRELRRPGGNNRASTEVEELAYGEKIAEALASCETYLEKSIAASKSACEESDYWVWHSAAELEYVLFLLSLKGSEDVTLNWKTGSSYESDSTAKLFDKVQNLVIRSKELTATGDWPAARRCAYAAGNILLRIQREHTRKKQGSTGK